MLFDRLYARVMPVSVTETDCAFAGDGVALLSFEAPDAALEHAARMGVRSIVPVHEWNAALGGAAFASGVVGVVFAAQAVTDANAYARESLAAARATVLQSHDRHAKLAIALGGRTMKMHQGHHGANHPVMDYTTGKVEIVSMNHGFAVDVKTLPANAKETHRSLFDGSNCGIALTDRPAFSVQHHPEASPGPQDSHYLFARFVDLMDKAKAA